MVAQQSPPGHQPPIPKELRFMYPSFTPDGSACHLLSGRITEQTAKLVADAIQFAIVHSGWSVDEIERLQHALTMFRFEVPKGLQAEAEAMAAHAKQVSKGKTNG